MFWIGVVVGCILRPIRRHRQKVCLHVCLFVCLLVKSGHEIATFPEGIHYAVLKEYSKLSIARPFAGRYFIPLHIQAMSPVLRS
jgi:hypothetical protein